MNYETMRNHDSRFTIHDSRFTIHDSRFTIHDSRFTIHDSRFTIHDSRFTIHDSRFARRTPSAFFERKSLSRRIIGDSLNTPVATTESTKQQSNASRQGRQAGRRMPAMGIVLAMLAIALGAIFSSGSALAQPSTTPCGANTCTAGTASGDVSYTPATASNAAQAFNILDNGTYALNGTLAYSGGATGQTGMSFQGAYNNGYVTTSTGAPDPSTLAGYLNLGNQTTGVVVTDPSTGVATTILTYGTFTQSFPANSDVMTGYTPGASSLYINAPIATVAGGGTFNMNASGTLGQNPQYVKQTTFVTVTDGTANWTSFNQVATTSNSPPSVDSSGQMTSQGVGIPVTTYPGTFTVTLADGTQVSQTVNSLADLQTYNTWLQTQLASGALDYGAAAQTAYNADLAQGAGTTTTYNYTFNPAAGTPFSSTDPILAALGNQRGLEVNGSSSTASATISQSGGLAGIQYDAAPGQVLVQIENGGTVINNGTLVGTGGNAQRLVNTLSGSAFTNNGLEYDGYYTNNGAASGITAYGNQLGNGDFVSGTNSLWINNGTANLAGALSGFPNTHTAIVNIQSGGKAVNNGAMNVNSSTSDGSGSGWYGASVASGSTFINSSSSDTANNPNGTTGVIYIGRAAYTDVTNAAATISRGGADVAAPNNNFGIIATGGATAQNDGQIIIGSLVQNGIGIGVSGAGVNITSSGTITDNGNYSNSGSAPAQNIGISSTATGTITNSGIINLNGANGVGLSVSGGGAATSSGAINVAASPSFATTGLRNLAMQVSGTGSTGTLSGPVNLNGDGAFGLFAQNAGTINITGSGTVNFNNNDQIGYYVYGTGSTINNSTTGGNTVSTQNSVLLWIAAGASFTGSTGTMTASGSPSTILIGTGTGSTVTTGSALNVSGTGAIGVNINGGATGTIQSSTTVNLSGANTIAGSVDGRTESLDFSYSTGTSASTLTNAATINSSTSNVTAFLTQYDGTLINNGVINLSAGSGNTGIIAQNGGNLTNTANITVASGTGILVQGAASSSPSAFSNTATIEVDDGTAGIEITDGASLTSSGAGTILTKGTADGVLIGANAASVQLGSNSISALGTGAGVNNAGEIADVSFQGTQITTANGAAIRTATSFVDPYPSTASASTATLTVTGSGEGFAFQQASGSAATGNLNLGSGYTINVTGSSGTHGGVGILANTTGTAATAATVNVTDTQGGAALELGSSVTSGSNSGKLTSASAAAPTVDVSGATSFTNTGTISNTAAGYLVAVKMEAANATVNDTGTINGSVLTTSGNNTVNVGSASGGTATPGTVTGNIQLNGTGANNVLITGGSTVNTVTGSTGNDTVTIQGNGNTFTALNGNAGAASNTAVFDDAAYTLASSSAISNYSQVNVTNGSTLTLQTTLAGTPTGGAGIAVDNASTLAVAPSPVAATTLSNALTGAGLVKVNTGTNAFDFASTTGSAFAGTVELATSAFSLAGVNTTALTKATLKIDTGSTVTVGAGNQQIGGLAMNGGTLAAAVSPTTVTQVTVTGATTLNGTLNIAFAAGSYSTKQYTLVTDTGGIAGQFATVNVTGLPAGFTYTVTYDGTHVILALDAPLGSATEPVPGMGRFALMGLALLLAALAMASLLRRHQYEG